MTTSHTPGPFVVLPSPSITGPIKTDGLCSVARIDGNVTMTLAELVSPVDAALFAAAPDLLAALQNILQWLDGKPFVVPTLINIEAARAAIAKAVQS